MADPETNAAAADWNTRKDSPSASMIEVQEYVSSYAEPPTSGHYSYKLFVPDDADPKTPRQQLVDKLQLDDDPEHVFLVNSINETISCNRQLSMLYYRVERDPYLFAITFLNTAINGQLDIQADAANSLVFSVINLIRNEAVMRRAIEPALSSELIGIRTPVGLLRNNTQTTRLLTLCAKALGQNIIASAVQPVIRHVLESDVTFEIDPTVQQDDGVRKINLKALCDTAADVLRRVIADIPSALVSVCRITHAAIEAKFPDHGWIGISNVIFLRFICSSILAPASGSSILLHQKRNLVLLAKLIQSAASLRKFDAKETFMQATNKFLDTVIPQLQQFYKRFAANKQPGDDALPPAMRSYLVVRKISSLTRIAEYLDALSNNPNALSLTSDSLTARIAYHLGFRRIVFSALHDCIFIYEDSKPSSGQKATHPLERYPIEAIEMPISAVNGVLTVKVPEPVRLQFTDDEECLKWRHHIESHIQTCKLP